MPARVGGAKPGHLVLEPKWPFQVAGPLRIYARPFVNEVLADKPLLYWRQDESSGTTAADASGNGHTGTYGAGVTLGAASLLDADPDTAATYNDTSSAIITSAYNPFTAGAKLTFIGWSVLPNFLGQRELFGGLSNSNAPTLIIAAGGGQPLWLTDVAAGSVAWTGGDFPAAQTVFWALTYDDTSRVSELFIGTGGTFVSKGTKTSAASFNAAPGNLVLGTFGTNNGWLGTMDEFAVFGAVLSADRLQTYYNARLIPVTSAGGTANSFVLTASDSITFAESTTVALGSVRTPTDSITFAETPTRTVSDARAATDSVTFSESLAAQAGRTRSASDSITFSESAARAALSRIRTATDSLTFAESLTRTASAARAISDSVTFSEAIASGKAISRTGTDSITFSESLTRAAGARTRTASDSITFSESLARSAQGFSRTGTDSVTFNESVTSGKAISRTATDSVTFSETLTRGPLARSRTSSDSITFSESLARTQGLAGRTAADSLTFSESITSGKAISRTATDSVTFSEALTRSVGRVRTATDNVTFSDSATRGTQNFTRASVDSVTFTEALSSSASTQPGTRWKMGPSGHWAASAGTRWPGDTSPRWDGATGTRWQPGATTRWS